MAKTPLQELADHGQSVWIDYLSRPFVQDGDLAGLVEQGIEGVTSNPTIFQGAIAEGDAYDDQIREIVSNGESEPKEIFIALACGRHPRRLRRPAPRLRRGRRQGRLRLVRGRPEPRARHAGHDRGGQAPPRPDRQAQPVHQDPRHEGGPARDRGDDRRRHPRQRDADLLARAPPRGRRGLHPRRPAPRGRGRRPLEDRLGRLVLRLARRHGGRQAPRRGSAATTSSRASSRSPTPSSPTSSTRRSSRARHGRRWRPRAPRSSAACGRRPRRRTPSTAT